MTVSLTGDRQCTITMCRNEGGKLKEMYVGYTTNTNTCMHCNIIMLVCRGCMHKCERGHQTRWTFITADELLLFIHCMQLFARRSKYVKAGAEAKWWSQLSYKFMTEESGGQSAEEIVRHELPWRSESEFLLNIKINYAQNALVSFLEYSCMYPGANHFIQKLDKRHRKKEEGKGRSRFQQKKRVIGTPSTLPREEGPKWALKEVATDSPAAEDKEDGDSTSSEEESSDCFSDIELPA